MAPSEPTTPRVGRAAMALGFAGLLPALAATGLLAIGRAEAVVVALLYPALILSFLGGIWWGFAMRRPARQNRLAAVAVVPSLVAAALVLGAVVLSLSSRDPVASARSVSWALVALGTAILLTLPVDRHLVRTGEAPDGWMRLRVPLSLGLGGLTILSSVLFAGLIARL